jgi:secondary thiamine-phosphate synthase enzyme
MVITQTISLSCEGNADMVDITGTVARTIQANLVQNGIVTIFCPSSTSGVTTIEYEPGVLKDLERLFDEIINPNREYQHNARWGDGNGHSHVRAALLKPSLTIPIVNHLMALGTWQQILFIDFDNRPRQRELVVQIMGE